MPTTPLRRKTRRLYAVLFLLLGFGAATALVMMALSNNIAYFRTPTDVTSGHCPEHDSGRAFRLGGLVEKNSLKHNTDGVTFSVTDLKNHLTVTYKGLLPDLFREGQGVVAEGKMDANGVFVATTLLAKHDEKYMPPEVAKELKDQGKMP